jgi:hypothetical protein
MSGALSTAILRILIVSRPIYIEADDLTRAWLKALEALLPAGVKEITPLVVSVGRPGGTPPMEILSVRQAVDSALRSADRFSSETVANTIFPQRLWDRVPDREALYHRYRRLLPRLRRVPQNRLGTYFGRLTAFGRESANQLEHIITTFERGNHRRSALQASLFDPNSDHTHQRRRPFPCLQQVAFLPNGEDGLGITAFYATQYIFDRAYGNYLGLCRLGNFVAHELNRHFSHMVCVAAVAQLGSGVTKAVARRLASELEAGLQRDSTAVAVCSAPANQQ